MAPFFAAAGGAFERSFAAAFSASRTSHVSRYDAIASAERHAPSASSEYPDLSPRLHSFVHAFVAANSSLRAASRALFGQRPNASTTE